MGNRITCAALLALALLLSACAAAVTRSPLLPGETNTPLPVPPTPTPPDTSTPSPQPPPSLTPSPTKTTPTLTPTPTPVFATEPDQIIGTWLGLGGRDAFYTRFDSDGTCRIAKIQDLLETKPNAVCTYYFDGDQLILLFDDESTVNLPKCGPDPAIYKVQILRNYHIKLILVNDPCSPRIQSMRMEYEPVR